MSSSRPDQKGGIAVSVGMPSSFRHISIEEEEDTRSEENDKLLTGSSSVKDRIINEKLDDIHK